MLLQTWACISVTEGLVFGNRHTDPKTQRMFHGDLGCRTARHRQPTSFFLFGENIEGEKAQEVLGHAGSVPIGRGSVWFSECPGA